MTNVATQTAQATSSPFLSLTVGKAQAEPKTNKTNGLFTLVSSNRQVKNQDKNVYDLSPEQLAAKMAKAQQNAPEVNGTIAFSGAETAGSIASNASAPATPATATSSAISATCAVA